MKASILLVLLLQGCMYGAGIGVRPMAQDNAHLDNMSNPVGIIRVEQQMGNVQFFAEHLSSIPDSKEDYGINVFGANYMFGSR